MAALQLLALESDDDSEGSVLHNLEEILVDLKKLIVPCRAGTRSGSAAASPAAHAWVGCSHPPLPQFPCLERRLKGAFPSLAGTGKHELEMSPWWDRVQPSPIQPSAGVMEGAQGEFHADAEHCGTQHCMGREWRC